MIPDKTDCLILRQSVHMYLRQQEYPKIRITTVNAHLLAGMHNLSTHNGLASEDSAGLSSKVFSTFPASRLACEDSANVSS